MSDISQNCYPDNLNYPMKTLKDVWKLQKKLHATVSVAFVLRNEKGHTEIDKGKMFACGEDRSTLFHKHTEKVEIMLKLVLIKRHRRCVRRVC